ncbi:MAG: nucleotidyltransferase domain-containing protein [Candidatus Thiodiazotropha sp. (ex Rostrolucina anterorostrata)]|nr:nucleotidyltransferase domain-containing protein [Candidatus Thiodiazotropha sp. (ex Rostrolucina anterorostrata)]
MPSLLADIMFKEYRRRVLCLLLLRPDQAYHVREIARLTGTVPGTLHKELSKLAQAGVLKKSSRGNQVSYQANRDCLIFEELSSILRKTSGVADILVNALACQKDNIDAALVFGSIASGKATSDSDIDLLIVGNVSFSEAVKALYPAQDVLGREINPKLYNTAEWQSARKENSAFIREILEKPTIRIIGDTDDLG